MWIINLFKGGHSIKIPIFNYVGLVFKFEAKNFVWVQFHLFSITFPGSTLSLTYSIFFF